MVTYIRGTDNFDTEGVVGINAAAGSVGTYTLGRPKNATSYSVGDTASNIASHQATRGYWSNSNNTFYEPTYAGYSHSGTWRAMTPTNSSGIGLWMRIA